MAVLRGGRRIGNFDIRLGLPRDKSLVDIHKDPRLKRKPGGSGTISRFISQVNQGEGFARNNRYLVRINLPKPIRKVTAGVNDLESNQIVENINMMCNKVTLPNRDIATAPHLVYGPRREMPYAYQYSAQIECTFYGDKFLRQRMFFENWQKKIIDINSHDMKYYDDYVGSMDIFQLGQFDIDAELAQQDEADAAQGRPTPPAKPNDLHSVTYGVRLYEVYPQTIGSIDFTYASENEITNVPVTLNFRTWANLTIDQVDGATVGKTEGDVPTIKASKDFGLFGGILNKMPPELRRAGRDILQTTRRNLPIGRVTGGRLFPPFGR